MKYSHAVIGGLGIIFMVTGLYRWELHYTAATATYGNFDVPGMQSWLVKLGPGIDDLASRVVYGRLAHEPLVAVGLLFSVVLLLTIFRKLDLIKRLLIQWSVFVIARLGVLRVAGICPVKRTSLGIFPFLNCQACEMATGACPLGMIQWELVNHRFPALVIGILLVSGVIFGRSICGWLCPFGLVSDLFDYISFKRINPWPEKPAYLKYALLFSFTTAPVWGSALFCAILCQSGVWLGLLPYYLTTGKPALIKMLSTHLSFWFSYHLLWGLVFLLGVVIIGGRWFCRYLCPLGAWYGLFNRISMIKVTHNHKKCSNCSACVNVCPMGIDLRKNDFINVSNCISCGRCTRLCKARNFYWSGPRLLQHDFLNSAPLLRRDN